jgi:hypothetical protein
MLLSVTPEGVGPAGYIAHIEFELFAFIFHGFIVCVKRDMDRPPEYEHAFGERVRDYEAVPAF